MLPHKLRILLVLNEAPLPFGHAVGRWYWVLLRGLVERGHRVTAFATCAKTKDIAQAQGLFPAPNYDLRLYPFPERYSVWGKWQTLRRPYSYMIHPQLRRDLHAELGRGYDVLHLEGMWSGWLGERGDPKKVVLNYHNLYDLDLAAQPSQGRMDRVQQLLRRRAEHHLLRSYGTLLTLTPRLADAARVIAPRTPVHVVPLGIDTSLYPLIPLERRPAEPVISVIGSMNWYPSFSAAARLLTRLLPAIREKIPNARVLIAGWHAQRALRPFLPQPGVQVLENVPDARPFFERSSQLLYAPMSGSGMKVKVLESFAYGVPVVTTFEGIEGIPAHDGIHVSCSDDDAGLVERSVYLLKNPSQQEVQRLAARKLLNDVCNPRVVLDGIEACYADMGTRRRSRGMNALETIVQKTKGGLRLTSHSRLIRSLRPGYDLLLNTIYGSSGLDRRIHGERPVRLLPRYRSISEAAEAPVFAALKSRSRPGGIILDVGANVGLFSLVMARWVGEAGRIFAFEPAPESLRALRRHIQLNGMTDRIEAVGSAVSDRVGETTFYAHTFSGENTLSASFSQRVPAACAVTVPVTTIDAFCATQRIAPTLLKIDIEGYEIHALRGARDTLMRHHPSVVVELHPAVWPEIGVERNQFDRTLRDIGYRRSTLEGQTDALGQHGHVMLEPIR